jgi:hypothetical protein
LIGARRAILHALSMEDRVKPSENLTERGIIAPSQNLTEAP